MSSFWGVNLLKITTSLYLNLGKYKSITMAGRKSDFLLEVSNKGGGMLAGQIFTEFKWLSSLDLLITPAFGINFGFFRQRVS